MTQKHPDNLLAKIKERIDSGKYRISKHAIERLHLRDLDLRDALYILRHGFHEENKTLFDNAFQTWKYAIRGKTPDALDLRVIVSFDEELVIIITLIRVMR